MIKAHHSCRDYTTVIQAAAEGCASALEPGAQFGWNLQKLPPHVTRRVGVEVHKPYVDDPRCVKAGIAWVIADARNYLADELAGAFDLVLLMDFVEHFDYEDAAIVIAESKRIAAKRVLWWCPIGEHPQDWDEWGLGGERWQTHRSVWDVGGMERLGFDTALWRNHHSARNCKGRPRKSRDAAFGVWEP